MGWLGESRRVSEERKMSLAVVPVVAKAVFSACSQALDAGTAKGIALDLTKGPFNLRYPCWVVFLFLLKCQDVAVLHARSSLQAFDGGAACG